MIMKLLKIIFIFFIINNNLLANTDYFNQGLILFKKNDLEKAKFKFEQDLVLNPKNEEATYNLAQLKLKKSDFEGSKKLIEKLIIFCKDYCQKSQSLKIEIEKSQKK